MTMMHPSEDELIQHLCGENAPADRERLQEHLAACDECRLACAEITGALTMVNDAVPEPPDGFERVMWARVQQAIALEPKPARWSWRALVPAVSLAAAGIAGIAIASRPDVPPVAAVLTVASTTETAQNDDAAGVRDRVLYTALNDHFQQTERWLVEVRNASERDSLAYERVSAEELVSAGRLYRMTAQDTGHRALAMVLDELEPVLVEVARSPERLSKSDRAWLQSRIEQDALLFKVRAASNDIRERVGHADQ